MAKKIIKGTLEKPRLSVFRSNNHIYAQVIDDTIAKTILSSSTCETIVKERLNSTSSSNCSAAAVVGQVLGSKLKEQNISQIVFDRGRYPYHGRIKALADGVRESGLKF